ncbi:MAG: tryptophan halogenase family protein [Asticcacaulis sp.]|uniref:tryptophan halogenase family protein n=1 Tax=Asticcacaulis sp. TaxID=1872648 RepID=UPI003F7B9574
MAGVRKLVIIGGGAAGWMCAAAFARALGGPALSVTLIESEEIGTVGVGEATIPTLLDFNAFLGVDENAFMRETAATYKLGIEFVNWSRPNSRYFHPFGDYGVEMNGVAFTHYWLRYLRCGGASDFGLFNAQTLSARQGRFGRLQEINPNIPPVNYAFHFDAGLYGRFLRKLAEGMGVTRIEGRIERAEQDAQTGDVTAVALTDGRRVEGDLFIDCSGFRGLLISETLKVDFVDWSHWLPCNRAAAVACDKTGPALPFTRSTAQEAGWQWRIPLQHRTGNGYVFCDAYLSEDEACAKLLSRLDGPSRSDPRVLKFTTGHRKRMWVNNVVAIGLSSGFLEPLESTAIHLAQTAIFRLLKYFPNGPIVPALRDGFNTEILAEYDNVKDFLIAHYKITRRDDTPFWRACRDMAVPDSLKNRLDVFAARNITQVKAEELFKEASWFAVLAGQGLIPASYHPAADRMPSDEFRWRMDRIREGTQGRAAAMPPHEAWIAAHCAMTQQRSA